MLTALLLAAMPTIAPPVSEGDTLMMNRLGGCYEVEDALTLMAYLSTHNNQIEEADAVPKSCLLFHHNGLPFPVTFEVIDTIEVEGVWYWFARVLIPIEGEGPKTVYTWMAVPVEKGTSL